MKIQVGSDVSFRCRDGGITPENAAERAGALLFAAANAMRLAGVDAEEALTFASKRYCAELLAQKEQSGTQVE